MIPSVPPWSAGRSLTLPFPPSVNHYWLPVKSRLVLSKEGRQYQLAAWHAVLEQWGVGHTSCLTNRLRVRIDVYPATKRKFDLDNLCKGILDSLVYARIFQDDSQIDDLHIVRHPPEGTPGRVVVEMHLLGA